MLKATWAQLEAEEEAHWNQRQAVQDEESSGGEEEEAQFTEDEDDEESDEESEVEISGAEEEQEELSKGASEGASEEGNEAFIGPCGPDGLPNINRQPQTQPKSINPNLVKSSLACFSGLFVQRPSLMLIDCSCERVSTTP